MCGRTEQSFDLAELRARFLLSGRAAAPNIPPRWNAAPTQDLAVIHAAHDPAVESGRAAMLARWGLVPSWAKDPKIAFSTINDRDVDENGVSIDRKPAFRDAFRARRCLVPVNGFYEWKTLNSEMKGSREKQPYRFALASGEIMAFAGLWETWRSPGGERLHSFTIVTTAANALLAPLHHRMPVILGEDAWSLWLGEEAADAETLKALLKPFPENALTMWPVSRRLNNVRNEGADLAEPVPEPVSIGVGPSAQGSLF